MKFSEDHDSLKRLLETVAALRSEKGCPWDRAQTNQSLKKYLLEETYELMESIDHLTEEQKQVQKFKDELGDLLFQICLHAQIAADSGHFDFYAVAGHLNRKMIERHPHVFEVDNQDVLNMETLSAQWDSIKAKQKEASENPFDSIPKELPALARALKLAKKAEKLKLPSNPGSASLVGNFDFNSIQNQEQLAEMLWLVILRSKELKLDPEDTLRTFLDDRVKAWLKDLSAPNYKEFTNEPAKN